MRDGCQLLSCVALSGPGSVFYRELINLLGLYRKGPLNDTHTHTECCCSTVVKNGVRVSLLQLSLLSLRLLKTREH